MLLDLPEIQPKSDLLKTHPCLPDGQGETKVLHAGCQPHGCVPSCFCAGAAFGMLCLAGTSNSDLSVVFTCDDCVS